MTVVSPTVRVDDALILIAMVDKRNDLWHLQVKKYRNFLTLFSFSGSTIKRHARLALREDLTWQLHLPVAGDEWEQTRLVGSFEGVAQVLFDNYGVDLGKGPEVLRASLIRDRYLCHEAGVGCLKGSLVGGQ